MSNERIGIRAIQSILQKATQSNLSMFHNAGNITSDSIFPRPSIREILDLDPNMSCSMNGEVYEGVEIEKKELVGSLFSDFLISMTLSTFLDKTAPDNIWYRYRDISMDYDFIRYYLDPRKFVPLGYTLEEIADYCFKEHYKNTSPDFMGIIDVSTEKLLDYADVHMYLSGSQKIKDMIVIDNRCYTIGSDLEKMLSLRTKVPESKIASNNILDVERLFGIEAARQLIIQLLDDDRYPRVVADLMTRSGKVRAIKKNNVSLYNRGFLSDISFERVRDSIVQHVPKVAEDNLESIYSKIWYGKVKNNSKKEKDG